MHLQALKPDQPRSYSKGLPIRTAYLFPIARSLISSKREYPITLFHSQPALISDTGWPHLVRPNLCRRPPPHRSLSKHPLDNSRATFPPSGDARPRAGNLWPVTKCRVNAPMSHRPTNGETAEGGGRYRYRDVASVISGSRGFPSASRSQVCRQPGC
jgi:hypothetical protein